MNSLLMHHLGRNDLTGIRNCHIHGLHSIMLHDSPGNRVRLYVASEVDTYNNYLASHANILSEIDFDAADYNENAAVEDYRHDLCHSMNLGLHGHRTEVRLQLVAGTLYNITAQVEEFAEGQLMKYAYESAIDGAGTITPTTGNYRVVDATPTPMEYGKDVVMAPTELHTIHVHGFAAWLVYERGEISPDYVSEFYSYNHDAEEMPPNMYETLSPQECSALLAMVVTRHATEATARVTRSVVEAQAEKNRGYCSSILAALNEYTSSNISERSASNVRRLCGYDHSPDNRIAFGRITQNMLTDWIAYLRTCIFEGGSVSATEFSKWYVERSVYPSATQTSAPRPPRHTTSTMEAARTYQQSIADMVARPSNGSSNIFRSR